MTNTTTVVDMRKFVEARKGEVFTTSQNVAEAFGKLHNHVLAKMRGLECSAQFLTDNFSSVQFEHRGNTYEAFEMTKDGFMFLVMGFTGKKAATIKEGYIAAFNWMAEQLGISSKALVATAVEQSLGVDGARKLSNVMRCRVAKMDVEHQRSATAKLSSALHARFGVPRLELIPASQMDSACNFVASYAIEGEYVPKEPKHQPNLSYPLETLVARRPSMLIARSGDQAWLDITLHDLRDIRGDETPLEKLLWELEREGYNIRGAWFEFRTYRNKLRELCSFAAGMGQVVEKPHRYAVNGSDAA